MRCIAHISLQSTYLVLRTQQPMHCHATIYLFSLPIPPRPGWCHQECLRVCKIYCSTRIFTGPPPTGISSSPLRCQLRGTCYQNILCHCSTLLPLFLHRSWHCRTMARRRGHSLSLCHLPQSTGSEAQINKGLPLWSQICTDPARFGQPVCT